jgi:hypothetical protein
MPKLSVYVGDDLWRRACEVDPLAKPSQLMQRGLECLLRGRSGDEPAVQPPAGAAERIEELRAVFAAQARSEYETGYAGALDAAGDIPWFVMEDFANQSFDVRRWIEGWRRSATAQAAQESPPGWLGSVGRTLGDLADPIGFDQFSFRPTRARVRGFGDALQAVWHDVDLHGLGLDSGRRETSRHGAAEAGGGNGESAAAPEV